MCISGRVEEQLSWALFFLFNNVSIMWISVHFSGQVAMNRKKMLLRSKCSILMLIFLNKYIGNFEKWIKFIEFSLKTTKEFNSYLSFS